MPSKNDLIVYKFEEGIHGCNMDNLENKIRDDLKNTDDAELLLDFPVVYIHLWKGGSKIESAQDTRYKIYIGETEDLIQRQRNHWDNAKKATIKDQEDKWQSELMKDVDENGNPINPTLYVIGHRQFNKSLTLDIEDRMIGYALAMDSTIKRIENGRGNPQRKYSGSGNRDTIFEAIWRKLHDVNPDVFLASADVKKSSLYKASPNHVLNLQQKDIAAFVMKRIHEALNSNKEGQLVMVEGDAGTGKTVLASKIFYDLISKQDEYDNSRNAYMLVQNKELLKVYQSLASRLGFNGKKIVLSPSTFLNACAKGKIKKVDTVLVDEAHLVRTQKSRGYGITDKLILEMMKYAKVTVIMFDEYQALRKEQYIEKAYVKQLRELSKEQGNHKELSTQMRMYCSESTVDWIDKITKEQKIVPFEKDPKYDIKIFDSPEELHNAIKKIVLDAKNMKVTIKKDGIEKAREHDAKKANVLSRLIASYDWNYNENKRPNGSNKGIEREDICWGERFWGVSIGEWVLPWNREMYEIASKLRGFVECGELSKMSKWDEARIKRMCWAEMEHTIDEVGSTFTIQGFDLAYAGVILGKSIVYNKEKGKIEFITKEKKSKEMKGKKKLFDGTTIDVEDVLCRNELRVLLTRGSKGLFIYAEDEALREKLKEALE